MKISFKEDFYTYKIKVVGVGGAGGNSINRMMNVGIDGVEFIEINTDAQVLSLSKAPRKIQIGKKLTQGLGSGGDPEVGRNAIEENKDEVRNSLAKTDIVFITCGMGGGTGTGASNIVAQLAKSEGALTIGMVYAPFTFEGKVRIKNANEGIRALREEADTIIVIPNDRLLDIEGQNIPIPKAFRKADELLLEVIKGISELITKPGLINLDFADIRTIMSESGEAVLAVGKGYGQDRAIEAAESAMNCVLLGEASISGAKGILINVRGGEDLTVSELANTISRVREVASEEANIIFGALVDGDKTNEVAVTVIATGAERKWKRKGTLEHMHLPYGRKDSHEVTHEQENLEIPTFVRHKVH
jgi:cell division protein FtsZ